MFDEKLIDASFPKQSFRDGQREAIEFIVKSFNSGNRFVILECPVGGGKSAIGMTLANMASNSYYLTITKILQDQLTADFDNIVDLKGRSSYPCTYWDRYGQQMVDSKLITQLQLETFSKQYSTCDSGFCKTTLNVGKDKFKCSRCFAKSDGLVKVASLDQLLTTNTYSDCPYYDKVYTAINSKNVTMNFSNFIYQTQFTKRFNDPRHLLIIDEAHNIESQLLDFVSLTISDYYMSKYNITVPQYTSPIEYYQWAKGIRLDTILNDAIENANAEGDARTADDLTRMSYKFIKFMQDIEKSKSEWVCEYEEKTLYKKRYSSVTLRPVFVNGYAEEILFKHAQYVLLMSATILDVNVIKKSLGIDDVAAYRMRSRFPVANRPIYLRTVAKMTGGKSNMHNWAPKMLSEIEKISSKYPDKKGIIHTHNFAIMEYVIENSSDKLKSRLLSQRDFKDKAQLIEHHAGQSNSILIAPAMHEGVDLKDDLSRFQIICKVPYPNAFEDKQLARRVELDNKYYSWLTALKLCQSYGRSIRSETDYADTYIIDESIHRFITDASNLLPLWFKEAIQRSVR